MKSKNIQHIFQIMNNNSYQHQNKSLSVKKLLPVIAGNVLSFVRIELSHKNSINLSSSMQLRFIYFEIKKHHIFSIILFNSKIFFIVNNKKKHSIQIDKYEHLILSNRLKFNLPFNVFIVLAVRHII